MHTVTILGDFRIQSASHQKVAKAVSKAQSLKVKVYETVVRSPGGPVARFITGAKGIHLSLGTLGETGRLNLALLLIEEFAKTEEKMLVLFEDKERKSGMIAILQNTSEGVDFNLSPVN